MMGELLHTCPAFLLYIEMWVSLTHNHIHTDADKGLEEQSKCGAALPHFTCYGWSDGSGSSGSTVSCIPCKPLHIQQAFID